MLPIKKLYIDSKARTADSKSTSEFAVDLVESLTMPEGAKFQVCDVLIPHTWYLIDEHNQNLYFRELNGFVGDTFMIRIDIGNYDGDSMAGEISKQIQSVTRQFQYAVSYDSSTEVIHVTATGKMVILAFFNGRYSQIRKLSLMRILTLNQTL